MRCWLHVEDAVEAISAILRQGSLNDIYNISGDDELSVIEVLNRITDFLDLDATERVETVPDRPGQDVRYMIDDSKVRELGWSPKIAFDEGLRSAIEYTIENPHW